MRIGRSRSSKVIDFGINRKGVCDFLLVINSNFGPILHRFWDNGELLAENCESFVLHPCLTPPFRGNPPEFPDDTYRAKTRGIGLLYGENCMILSSAIFDWSTRVTDRQTDGIAIAYARLSVYAVARKNGDQCIFNGNKQWLSVWHIVSQNDARYSDGIKGSPTGNRISEVQWSVTWPKGHGHDTKIFEAHYLNNHARYMVGSYWVPIGNRILRIQWSGDQWCHVTPKGQGHDPNAFEA